MVELDGWVLDNNIFAKGDVRIVFEGGYWRVFLGEEIKNTYSYVGDAIYECERSGICDNV